MFCATLRHRPHLVRRDIKLQRFLAAEVPTVLDKGFGPKTYKGSASNGQRLLLPPASIEIEANRRNDLDDEYIEQAFGGLEQTEISRTKEMPMGRRGIQSLVSCFGRDSVMQRRRKKERKRRSSVPMQRPEVKELSEGQALLESQVVLDLVKLLLEVDLSIGQVVLTLVVIMLMLDIEAIILVKLLPGLECEVIVEGTVQKHVAGGSGAGTTTSATTATATATSTSTTSSSSAGGSGGSRTRLIVVILLTSRGDNCVKSAMISDVDHSKDELTGRMSTRTAAGGSRIVRGGNAG
ncbi:hypothetical protein KCU81_g222, partial [Aureobasidium melanogenum]